MSLFYAQKTSKILKNLHSGFLSISDDTFTYFSIIFREECSAIAVDQLPKNLALLRIVQRTLVRNFILL